MKKLMFAALIVAAVGCNKPAPPAATSSPGPSATSSTMPSASPAAQADGQDLVGALQPDVQLDRDSYYPGDQIKVMAVATGQKDGAWVGVVPASVPHGKEEENDAHDLCFFYLNSGKDTLVAPKEVGDYDVRMNSDDSNGVELASRSFKVVTDPNPVKAAKILWKPSGKVAPEAQLEVPFEVPVDFPQDAWIGLLPSAVEHGSETVGDKNDKAYAYLEGAGRGIVKLKVPSEVGKYDLRLYDTNYGKELDSVSFEVGTN